MNTKKPKTTNVLCNFEDIYHPDNIQCLIRLSQRLEYERKQLEIAKTEVERKEEHIKLLESAILKCRAKDKADKEFLTINEKIKTEFEIPEFLNVKRALSPQENQRMYLENELVKNGLFYQKSNKL